jgi:hypothetical protein
VSAADAARQAPPGPIILHPGPPSWVVTVVAPVVAIGLVAARAATSGLSATSDDPVSPWIIAVLTIVVGVWLSYRSTSQRAELRDTGLVCRNLMTTFDVDWDRVEDLEVVRRGPLVVVEIRVRSLRRRLRLGAASRFAGDGADVVLDMIRAHPVAGALLVDDGS